MKSLSFGSKNVKMNMFFILFSRLFLVLKKIGNIFLIFLKNKIILEINLITLKKFFTLKRNKFDYIKKIFLIFENSIFSLVFGSMMNPSFFIDVKPLIP
jgi:hypothetical protein